MENPIRERKITVPVQVINKDVLTQAKLVPVGIEALNVSITIRGNALDIYSIKAEDFQLQSDLNAYVVRKGENKIPVEIKKSPNNIRIVNTDNLWVSIILEDLKQKVVPVKVTLDGKIKQGFFALQPVIKTTEVQVNGPADIVSAVNDVIVKCDITGLSKDINGMLIPNAEDKSGNIIKGVNIVPNSVEVIIPIKKTKSVPINVKTKGTLNNGGKIKAIVPTIAYVDIAGDDDVISGIASLDTEPIDLNKLVDKDTVESKIIVPKGVILVNNNSIIKVKINFDKGTQKQFNLDIQTKNLGDNYNVSLSNSKVNITVAGTEEVINNLKQEDITCFVDLSSLNEGDHTVNVTVNLPDGVTKVAQDPTNIKVTISKKVIGG
ncbi:CdaR family protein [Clostridium sp. DJ247]|uniref:CdaR family protein n=1 Tax=Clostridium sp. DJ247 TaxID=2726188 RepID=UPI0028BF3A7D|nr:CdaR family protein [Clostridium sp. DJ247]